MCISDYRADCKLLLAKGESRLSWARPVEQKARAIPGRAFSLNTGRDAWIRTSAPLFPKSLGNFLVRFGHAKIQKFFGVEGEVFWRNIPTSPCSMNQLKKDL